jgi:hypothetical protein
MSMDWFEGKSKPETMVFPMKYDGFLKMFPETNPLNIGFVDGKNMVEPEYAWITLW